MECRITAQFSSFMSLRNNLALTPEKLGNVLSAGVNQLYLISIKKEFSPCFILCSLPYLCSLPICQAPFDEEQFSVREQSEKSIRNPRPVSLALFNSCNPPTLLLISATPCFPLDPHVGIKGHRCTY